MGVMYVEVVQSFGLHSQACRWMFAYSFAKFSLMFSGSRN